VAIGIGVAATLAWQSYGETTKQMIATRGPALGWSPETKQMITSWVQQLDWTKHLRLASALPLTPLDALGEGQKSECASGEAGSLKRGNNQPSRPKNPNHTLTTTAPIKMPSVTFSAKVTACRLDGFQRALCNAIAPAQIIQAIRKLMSA